MSTYTSEAEVVALVNEFESCRTGKDAFKHQDHLTVAVCYLQELTISEATTKLRQNLLRFLDHHQVDRQKYNQTITVFWLQMVANVLEELAQGATLVEKCNAVSESLNHSELVFKYYSREKLLSDEAREVFVGPDLHPFN